MDKGTWQVTNHGVSKESDTTERLTLSLFFFNFMYASQHPEAKKKKRKPRENHFINSKCPEERLLHLNLVMCPSNPVTQLRLGLGESTSVGPTTQRKWGGSQAGQTPWALSECMHVRLLSCTWLFLTSWTAACQAPLYMGFFNRNSGVGCHFLLQGIFPTQRSNPCLLHWQADSATETPGKPKTPSTTC